MKTCTGCKTKKPVDEFSKDKHSKDGLQYKCKECNKLFKKIYRQKNKEKIKEYQEKNKEKIKEQIKEWSQKNKYKIAEHKKIYRQTNKERLSEYKKKWCEANNEKKRIQDKLYRQKNKDVLIEYNKNYTNNRKKIDPLFKLKCNLRVRTCAAFKSKNWSKNSKTQKLLGSDYKTVFNHIESRFTIGMTWDNYGKWHIDHIIPLSSAKTEEELIKLFHYTNTQPLWAEDNLKKGSKIIACKI